MTATARANGWRGFDGIGERAPGGWEYQCDGMPHAMGCGARVTVPRRLARVGAKGSGWLVTYGTCLPDEVADDAAGNDLDVVLTFCPSCAAVVRQDPHAPQVSPEEFIGARNALRTLASMAPPWCSSQDVDGACTTSCNTATCWINEPRCPDCGHRVGFHLPEGCTLSLNEARELEPKCPCRTLPSED